MGLGGRVRGDREAEGERRSTRKALQPTRGSVGYLMQWDHFYYNVSPFRWFQKSRAVQHLKHSSLWELLTITERRAACLSGGCPYLQ